MVFPLVSLETKKAKTHSPVMQSSAVGDSRDFHLLGADSNSDRLSGLRVWSRAFLLRYLSKAAEEKQTLLDRTHTELTAEGTSKDTAVDSGARHPAATPACRRATGLWLSAESQRAHPDWQSSVHRAAGPQRPGYSQSLGQTAEKP